MPGEMFKQTYLVQIGVKTLSKYRRHIRDTECYSSEANIQKILLHLLPLFSRISIKEERTSNNCKRMLFVKRVDSIHWVHWLSTLKKSKKFLDFLAKKKNFSWTFCSSKVQEKWSSKSRNFWTFWKALDNLGGILKKVQEFLNFAFFETWKKSKNFWTFRHQKSPKILVLWPKSPRISWTFWGWTASALSVGL